MGAVTRKQEVDLTVPPKHYTTGAMETVDKQAAVAKHLGDLDHMTVHFLLTAIKYVDRMGLKDDAAKDAFKAADYLHRAVTGEWLNGKGEPNG